MLLEFLEVPCHHPECWQPFIGCLLPLSPLKLSYWWKRCFPLLICCLSLCELPHWLCLASLQQTLTVKSRAFATQLLAAIHFQARMKPAPRKMHPQLGSTCPAKRRPGGRAQATLCGHLLSLDGYDSKLKVVGASKINPSLPWSIG